MFVDLGTTRLFVDIEGVGLDASAEKLREKPTLLLLHGGPSADHTMFKPAFGALADLAQIVYFDMRGAGRSQGGGPSGWNLAQWAADAKALCDRLGIRKPIVLGASFGGFVAQEYATRYPRHAGGLILLSTAARMPGGTAFDALADLQTSDAAAIAADAWQPALDPAVRVTIHRDRPSPAARRKAQAAFQAHAVPRPAVGAHFARHEMGSFDFRRALRKLACPTLVLHGDADATAPLPLAEEMAGRIAPSLVEFHVFHRAGHLVQLDTPKPVLATIGDFITRIGAPA